MNTESKRSLITRIRERLRYRLVMQEIVDTLNGRLGIVAYPYYIVSEGLRLNAGHTDERTPSYEVRFLRESDLDQLAKIQTRSMSEGRLRKVFGYGQCLGIFVNGRLAGVTWSREDIFPTPIFMQPLTRLANDEAYLFDMLVSREFRGYRLAPILRRCLYQELAKAGKSRLYSVTLAFNRSSRQFKQRLGAKEIELRIVVGISGWRGLDMRLKRLQSEAQELQSKSLITVLKANR